MNDLLPCPRIVDALPVATSPARTMPTKADGTYAAQMADCPVFRGVIEGCAKQTTPLSLTRDNAACRRVLHGVVWRVCGRVTLLPRTHHPLCLQPYREKNAFHTPSTHCPAVVSGDLPRHGR
ncbi:hypothetical protein DVU_2372 [Nitratidesulfovibrio vulgaris str. Hildenborough]|uniref:Uncharacterized protein n=1 Tax=Nitratidesulfovibrio vulgaris (strain ATCC 29579 / DSM 644 / CCUG 34227 / NCIMB 8303 / VKM B-1760 / Hildenborough) TaxID=882 RepID=Q729H9_NITV2|nr:hypothetical protein DVU_2372 [Nitratidesulfovibrio vulgaris str. Hildenborough]